VPAFGAAGRASKDGGDDAAANGEGEEAAEGDAVFGGPEIMPVVQLSEVPKHTGEEEEDVLYAGEVGRDVPAAVLLQGRKQCSNLLEAETLDPGMQSCVGHLLVSCRMQLLLIVRLLCCHQR
jgi:hypothetical protein